MELSDLPELDELHIGDNTVTEFRIKGAPQLRKIRASNNNLKDLSSVANLTSLQHISFSQNSLSDISALSQLENLGHIELQGNLIEDISPSCGSNEHLVFRSGAKPNFGDWQHICQLQQHYYQNVRQSAAL